MKTVLIISPYFPPVNAADMQRVRMSLPYFRQFGWDAEVVMVNEVYSDFAKDPLLLKNIPAETKIYKVKAFDKKWTSRIGLGSIALRSLYFYYKKVSRLLGQKKYDLIYFSTTQFPVCVLGAYWKKRYNVPYVIDMQDPWHSEYYKDKPKNERPPKYWFSYHLNKFLEPIAVKNADGLISVSADYIADLKLRYPAISNIPASTIPFGAFMPDMEIAAKYIPKIRILESDCINIVYVGRGGYDMYRAITPLFEALKSGLDNDKDYLKKLKFYFIGTSYAAAGTGMATILPLAAKYGLTNHIVELTDRVDFYHGLHILLQAEALFIPGSDDPKYTASKIYPYLLVNKPLLAIFNKASSAITILKEFEAKYVYNYDSVTTKDIFDFLQQIAEKKLLTSSYNKATMEKYAAEGLTNEQCKLFNQAVNKEVQ